jgi:lipid-A-disaccharide synthase-like uncharacterized protein
VIAMLALIAVGMWLVLQPTLTREKYDFEVRVGAVELLAEKTDDGLYRFVEPDELAAAGPMTSVEMMEEVDTQIAAWRARPAVERTLLGFFNITSWINFGWVAVGLGGQAAFFGRMLAQWVVSENRRESVVPEAFWWLSLAGGACLFTYFVWRVDFVGVLGQSTGVVIYARNLRLIHKQKRRRRRASEPGEPGPEHDIAPGDAAAAVHAGEGHEHARAAG